MDELEVLIQHGRFREAVNLARSLATPQAALVGARAALMLGEGAVAKDWMDTLPPFADTQQEAERLTMLGLAYFHLGDLERYHQLAQQAVALEQNYFTLFQLGQSLPPDQALPVLKEALAQATTPQDEGQAAYALARLCEKLGCFRDGFAYASLAILRDPDNPMVVLAWGSLALLGSDGVDLAQLVQRLAPYRNSHDVAVQLAALNLLAEVALVEGNLSQAQGCFEQMVSVAGKEVLPLFAWQGVRILLAQGSRSEAQSLARAAQLSNVPDPLFVGLGQLALGLALYPAAAAITPLVETIRLLETRSPGHTLIARIHLALLRREVLPASQLQLLEQWSPIAQRLVPTPPEPLYQGYLLEVLGRNRLLGPGGPVALRPRSLELLVLLLSRPEGWEREELSEALYSRTALNALKVELLRLKKALQGQLQPRPWRVTLPIKADFMELQADLLRGDLPSALLLYQGSLLVGSEAPGIGELREEIDRELRQKIVASHDSELLYSLLQRLPDDLEVAEALLLCLPRQDQRYYAVMAQLRRLKKQLGLV